MNETYIIQLGSLAAMDLYNCGRAAGVASAYVGATAAYVGATAAYVSSYSSSYSMKVFFN